MTPKAHALAYRIWAHCEPISWNCTMPECAEALGESRHRVRKVCADMGWIQQFRVTHSENLPVIHTRSKWLVEAFEATRLDEIAEAPRVFEVAE